MNLATIIAAAVVAAVFIAILAAEIHKKKDGGSSCSCGCGGCPSKDCCRH